MPAREGNDVEAQSTGEDERENGLHGSLLFEESEVNVRRCSHDDVGDAKEPQFAHPDTTSAGKSIREL